MSLFYRLHRRPSPSKYSFEEDEHLPFHVHPSFQLPADNEPSPPSPPSPRTPPPSSPIPPSTPPFVRAAPEPIQAERPSPSPKTVEAPSVPRIPRSQSQPLLRRILCALQAFQPRLEEARQVYRKHHLTAVREPESRRKTIAIDQDVSQRIQKQFFTNIVVVRAFVTN